MNNQNIISNKFNLNWSTLHSYTTFCFFNIIQSYMGSLTKYQFYKKNKKLNFIKFVSNLKYINYFFIMLC